MAGAQPRTMRRRLHRYYVKQGICPAHFTCPHEDECHTGVSNFVGPREPSIGKEYLSRSLPRLLFVSLDPGKLEESDPLELQVVSKLAKDPRWLRRQRKHWYRTHELARHLLGYFDKGMTIEQTRLYFAHTNVVRCCVNNPGSRQARAALYRNCRQYLADEILLLEPDIIVTQGNSAHGAVRKVLGDRATPRTRSGVEYDILALGKPEKTIWLRSVHPTARGTKYQDQVDNQWKAFRRIVASFSKNWRG